MPFSDTRHLGEPAPGVVAKPGEWVPGNESWRNGHPPPRQLTNLLSEAPTAKQLVEVGTSHAVAFNAVHCSAFWVRLGRLAKEPSNRQWLMEHGTQELNTTREHTLRLLTTFGPRQLANTAHGLAHCGLGAHQPWSYFWSRVASASVPVLREFQSQELKDLSWAFATAGAVQPRLFDALATEVAERLESLTPTETAMLSWSFAASGHEAQPVLAGLAYAASQKIGGMSSSELATSAWAFGRSNVGPPADAFFAGLGAELPARLEQLEPLAIATMAHGFGRSGRTSAAMLETIAKGVIAHHPLKGFGGRSLVTLATPFLLFRGGKLEPQSVRLIDRVITHAATRAQDLSPSSTVTLARAVAGAIMSGKLSHDSERTRSRSQEPSAALFSAIALAVPQSVASFGERELALLPWSFCRARFQPHRLPEAQGMFEAIAVEASSRVHEISDVKHINSLCWSFSHAFGPVAGPEGAADAPATAGAADAADAAGAAEMATPAEQQQQQQKEVSEPSEMARVSGDCEVEQGKPVEQPPPAKVPLPPVAAQMLDLLAEEVSGRTGELAEAEAYAIEFAYRRLQRPSPFGGFLAAAGEDFSGDTAVHNSNGSGLGIGRDGKVEF